MSESGEEMKYINHAFDSNWVAPLGPNVDGFEEDLKAFVTRKGKGHTETTEITDLSSKRVVALASGTAAVHLGEHLFSKIRDNIQARCTQTLLRPVPFR